MRWTSNEILVEINDDLVYVEVNGQPAPNVRDDMGELTQALRHHDHVATRQVLERFAQDYPEIADVMWRGLGLGDENE